MIIDKLQNYELYKGFNERIYKGLKFLGENDLNTLSTGNYEIEDDKVFAIVQEYETKKMEQGRWEGHYKYTDIHFIVTGEEKMGYVNMDETTKEEERPEEDVFFLEAHGDFVQVKEGQFAIFTPQDAHMPNIAVSNPTKVKKVVIKVAL